MVMLSRPITILGFWWTNNMHFIELTSHRTLQNERFNIFCLQLNKKHKIVAQSQSNSSTKHDGELFNFYQHWLKSKLSYSELWQNFNKKKKSLLQMLPPNNDLLGKLELSTPFISYKLIYFLKIWQSCADIFY